MTPFSLLLLVFSIFNFLPEGIELWCFKYTLFKINQEKELPVILWTMYSICGDCAGMLIIVNGWASWCFYRLLHMVVLDYAQNGAHAHEFTVKSCNL